MPEPFISTYTIFRTPMDLPGVAFAVRRFDIFQGGDEPVPGPLIGTADDLDGARRLVPRRADACFQRADGDDPVVVETWM